MLFTPCAKTYKPEGWRCFQRLRAGKAMKCELLLVQNEVERTERNEWAQCAVAVVVCCRLGGSKNCSTHTRNAARQWRRQLQVAGNGELRTGNWEHKNQNRVISVRWGGLGAVLGCQTRVYEPCGLLRLLLRTVTGPLRCHGNQKLLMTDGES